MKKQFITGVVIGGLTFGAAGVFAGQYMATENPFPVQLNGTNISLEGYNINDNTYFKLRDIADTVGGFTVGFENNTILLSTGESEYQDIQNNEIKYYDESNCFPDFGAYTGAKLKGQPSEKSYMYTASKQDLEKYESLLISLDYAPVSFNGNSGFAKDDCLITIIDGTDVSSVGILITKADFVSDLITKK